MQIYLKTQSYQKKFTARRKKFEQHFKMRHTLAAFQWIKIKCFQRAQGCEKTYLLKSLCKKTLYAN